MARAVWWCVSLSLYLNTRTNMRDRKCWCRVVSGSARGRCVLVLVSEVHFYFSIAILSHCSPGDTKTLVLISYSILNLNLTLSLTSVTHTKGNLSSSICCCSSYEKAFSTVESWYFCPFQRHWYWKHIKPVSWLFTHHRTFTPQAPFWCHALTGTRQEAGLSCDWTIILATQRLIHAVAPVLFLPHTPTKSHNAIQISHNFIYEHYSLSRQNNQEGQYQDLNTWPSTTKP